MFDRPDIGYLVGESATVECTVHGRGVIRVDPFALLGRVPLYAGVSAADLVEVYQGGGGGSGGGEGGSSTGPSPVQPRHVAEQPHSLSAGI